MGTHTVTQTIADKKNKKQESSTATITVKGPSVGDLIADSWYENVFGYTWNFSPDSIYVISSFGFIDRYKYTLNENIGEIIIVDPFLIYDGTYTITKFYDNEMNLHQNDDEFFGTVLELDKL